MESEIQVPAPEGITFYLKDISVTDLPKRNLVTNPNPFATITVDGEQEQSTAIVHGSRNPKWGQELKFIASSPASIVHIKILHHSSISRPKLISELLSKVQRLVDVFTHDLLMHGIRTGRISLTATIAPNAQAPDPLNLANIEGERALVAFSRSDVSGSQPSKISEIADRVPPVSPELLAPFVSPLGQALNSLQRLVEIIDGVAEIHPICKAAWTLVSSIYTALRNQTEQDATIQDLAVSLRDMLAFANGARNLESLKDGIDVIKEMGLAIQDCAKLIIDYTKSPFFRRALNSAISTEMSTRIKDCQTRLAYLSEQFDRTIGVRTWQSIDQVLESTVRKERLEFMAKLPSVYTLQAGYDRVDKCLTGTCADTLQELTTWLANPDPKDGRILWLHGLAGMGKSTVAATVAQMLDDLHCLGGCFFFSRSHAERNTPQVVFATIASQLAGTFPKLAREIFKAIESEPAIADAAPLMQFKKLIAHPLTTALPNLAMPIVIILDALDECTPPTPILAAIKVEMLKLPPLFKLLLTSRPAPAIKFELAGMGSNVHQHSLQRDVSADRDIALFIKEHLATLAHQYGWQGDWPGETLRSALVQRASGLFIWAATAVRFIEDEEVGDPKRQLGQLMESNAFPVPMESSPWSALDALYLQVLSWAFPSKTSVERFDLFRKVVGAVVTIRSPLTAAGLCSLLGLRHPASSAGQFVKDTVWMLQSVLVVPDLGPLDVIHPSFVDFITDPARCKHKEFFIESSSQHEFLARRCLQVMSELLSLNICNVDPSLLNSEVDDLEPRIAHNIPEALQYACRFWAHHLSLTPFSTTMFKLVRSFYFRHLLIWLEVLSLLGAMSRAYESAQMAELWLQKFDRQDDEIRFIAKDALRFITEFQYPISQSATHVYYSALPFTPSATVLYRTYMDKLETHIPTVLRIGGAPSTWTSCVALIEGHSWPVAVVAFSPDGTRIVSIGGDTLCLWNATTGELLVEPVVEVRSERATFSGDGNKIVSYSTEFHYTTLNAHPYKERLTIIDGFTGIAIVQWDVSDLGSGTCVALSPGADRIAYAANNGGIYLYDETGTNRRQLTGHSRSVYCVAFSPDGTTIASGSGDWTVRLWDSVTGVALGVCTVPGEVWNVVFSPQGTEIRSIIRESTSGKNVTVSFNRSTLEISGGPFPLPERIDTQHLRIFSADSKRIVSTLGTDESNSLVVRDATTGEVVGYSSGHVGATITCLASSADGRRVVSGDRSGHIRIWDVETFGPVQEAPLETESHRLLFSPEGSRLISTRKKTVCIWDTMTGLPVGEPLQQEGHYDAEFSTDGTRVISRQISRWGGGTATVSDSLTGICVGRPPIGKKDFKEIFSPDGSAFLTTKDSVTWRLWDCAAGNQIGELIQHSNGPQLPTVMFSPDGSRFVTCSFGGDIYIWDRQSGREIGRIICGEQNAKPTLVFSPDGTRLIILPGWNPELRLIDLTRRIEIGRLPCHPAGCGSDVAVGRMYCEHLAAFSRDGRRIVTVSRDSIQLWDASSGSPIGPPLERNYARWLGRKDWQVASFSQDGEALLLELPNAEIIAFDLRNGEEVPVPTGNTHLVVDDATGWVHQSSRAGRRLWWLDGVNRRHNRASVDHRLVLGAKTGTLAFMNGGKFARYLERDFPRKSGLIDGGRHESFSMISE